MRVPFFVAILLGFISTLVSAQTVLKAVRVSASDAEVRLVWDASSVPEYKFLVTHHPERVVIEFKNTVLSQKFRKPTLTHANIQKWTVRSQSKNVQIVIDLKKEMNVQHFRMASDKKHSPRIVFDLKTPRPIAERPVVAAVQEPTIIPKATTKRVRPFVVVIDAGHGGHDSGAVGRRGTYEKDVVLSMAKKLESLIEKEPGMKAVMVRKGDYYVGLRQRRLLARQHHADLFISIHADSYPNSAAYGASVYILSQKGASSEAAKFLADRENRADLVGGFDLQDKDVMLASVLLDLSQSANANASYHLAQELLAELHKVVPLHKKHVERAGFMVLKSIDIPSVLVETGFISHPQGEAHLKSQSYQWDIARALMKGIREVAR